MKILLVEDNKSISDGLKFYFKKNNLNLEVRENLKDAKTFINHNLNLDLIILDLMLPDGSGFSLYEDFIKSLHIPVIFLTAKDNEDDIVKGLNMGAEDYITKPFSSKELLARVFKILNRNKKNIIKVKDISFDLDTYILKRDDLEITLTPLELKLITYMFLNINKTVTRASLIDKVYEWTGNDIDDHTVTVYFNRLRDKIKSNIIVTVKGVGYRIDEE